ncbi:MAG: Hint domain-containing protein [Roseicyclus sp.]|uniref:Hint domain-containing protein n=1 Tax=Roseicyclus sp. TaxID=1914329 RepID=UPI003A8392D3
MTVDMTGVDGTGTAALGEAEAHSLQGAGDDPVCFTPGTLIATPRGEVPVETLREGDRVITRDNGIQEIRWVGLRRLDRAALADTPALRPVVLRKGSLGHGLPDRDMAVSPRHGMLVTRAWGEPGFDDPEVLVPALQLLGRPGIVQMDTLRTTYIHILCDRHELVLSNGCWTESFQPGAAALRRLEAPARAEMLARFPELATLDGLGEAEGADLRPAPSEDAVARLQQRA